MIEKEVILTIGGTDFAFRVTTVAYNAYINELKPDSKVTPSIDFVRKALVDKKQRPELDSTLSAIRGLRWTLRENWLKPSVRKWRLW